MTDNKKKNSVEVSPESFVSMVLHAGQNPTTVVHGLLLGSFSGNDKVVITKAIPVCHETPTKPLLEIALGIVSASADGKDVVVGWYTAPERLTDTQPGPVALRIAANLGSDDASKEPVLLVLDNAALADCLKGDDSSKDAVIKAFGKDFGQQWMDPLDKITVTKESKARAAAASAFSNADIVIVDLVNHLEDDGAADWMTNTALTKHIAKVAP
mmetsp:Transcript_23089/g.38163  ORF Transcript_23089/g.38163 Transcript_23089/m.38163 type:complete len:213 (+) Transcript_23089:112-750(+)|eukprot:CAMPEP_0119014976 /NCGR_PEP_ID=MMETSP1176-20130426/10491_1 /TAXON_ID=265551 /ORGANISM="Synedropsis recta cf, Strain CCMP1620" /LENGTH=212 /DNA_ID=CAMNT_0006968231 /DNA_START=96 /DNA_END=734 /DNA_ORIENTATION=-